jgi:hypothetical protein
MEEIRSSYKKLEAELNTVQDSLKTYPKGSLRKRMINGRPYYYLQHREGKQVKSQYVKPEDVKSLELEIETRKELESRAKEMENRLSHYAALIGIHRSYRPIKNIDYDEYTLFMSTVAHDYKAMDLNGFYDKYTLSKYRGLNKRYLAGFLDYINGIDRISFRKTNDLVLDPYTYLMYFKYGQKEVLDEELERAIPAFLNRGLLITNIQEAVSGPFNK